MAAALGQGFVKSGLIPPDRIYASDPSAAARSHFSQTTGAASFAENSAVVRQSDIVFLAVKPHQIVPVAAELAPALRPEQLIVSVAAGVQVGAIQAALGSGARVVRVMPNTPCLVGKGACGFCLGPAAQPADAEVVGQLLGAVGIAYQVEEKLLDAVTGLSGSGPAFVYTFIEALSDGGVRMGLPRPVATALAMQTVLGAAQLALESGEHTGVLRDRVASPGGTTIAGIQTLEEYGLRAALIAAVEAATERAADLGS